MLLLFVCFSYVLPFLVSSGILQLVEDVSGFDVVEVYVDEGVFEKSGKKKLNDFKGYEVVIIDGVEAEAVVEGEDEAEVQVDEQGLVEVQVQAQHEVGVEGEMEVVVEAVVASDVEDDVEVKQDDDISD